MTSPASASPCGCTAPGPCPCAAVTDPQVISNKPGLAQISYRADDFTGFRRALLRQLGGEQAIAGWRPAVGDLGLQVLEWWAYLGDVLTFYNERIANESYLRTATRAASVANLVALLGYRPAPGIAATGTVAAIRSTLHPAEPLVIPADMRLTSSATPGVPAQTFEADMAASFSGPSTVPVALDPSEQTLTVDSSDNPQSVLLAGRVSGVRPGDQLLLVTSAFAGADDNWSLVTVATVEPAPDPGTGASNTVMTFGPGPSGTSSAGWGPGGVTSVSPDTTAAYRLLQPRASAPLWTQPNTIETDPVIGGKPFQVQLSAVVRAIAPGDLALFTDATATPQALAVVAKASEETWSVTYPVASGGTPQPPIPIAHTALTLTLADADSVALPTAEAAAITLRYGWKDVGTIIGAPASSLSALPATVTVPASYSPPPGAITAILQDANGAGQLVTVTAAGQSTTGPTRVLLSGIGNPPAQPATPLVVPLRLLLSLVPVSRGTTVRNEVLGSGNATLINQSFTLSKSPLSYLAAGAGAVAELAVYVDGVQWQEVPSFYGKPASARVYVVSRSPDQSVTTITFGDGVDGARLSSGTGNVTATYRYGSGAASPPAGRLTTISQPQPNLASIQNPVAVGGGADPQAPADVKANAPASVFTFGRAVSAIDYEVIAGHAPGVSRVAASWAFDGARQRTVVTIYVGDDGSAVTSASAALAGAEDPNRPVSVVLATAIPVYLSCTLVVAADRHADAVLAAATAAVCDPVAGLFSPAAMGIGQRLYRSAIDAALMVDGVLAVHALTVYRWQTFGHGIKIRNFQVWLDEVFDPGAGAYFALSPVDATIAGGTASD